MNFQLEQDNEFDKDGVALGKQLGFQVFDWDEFQEKLEEMGLVLGLDACGAWIVVDSTKTILAKLV